MKRFSLLLALSVCAAIVMGQSHNMVVHVKGAANEKITIPVNNIREITFEEDSEEPQPQQEGTAITFQFSDYSGSATRSPLKKAPALINRKYGVFGCFNNGEPTHQGSMWADLMKNQEVAFENGEWTYSPIKYWPEFSQNSNAVSFFAYSPYSENSDFVSVNPTSMEPVVEYQSVNPLDDAGDLLYGSQLYATKYQNEGRVSISSKHALARLNFKADFVDDFGENTKVTIGSVEISGEIPDRGFFNLYTQQWENRSTETKTYILKDENLSADLRDAGSQASAAEEPEGVGMVSKPIGVSPFLLVPTDGEKEIAVTIVYFITTDDPGLPMGYSKIENRITKSLHFSLNAGCSYDLRLHLGLTSVKYSLYSTYSWDETEVLAF
jgi:hypothetical protein